ncbi:hypothetical protein AURDEDRAFT_177296 [Auricularia subglabra TFB-10046 SS5]|uniref:Uncharacterized protein n=1 Tax=Auricularia subglabra (strain TFB-10046 / SS5) TaxID=717982 RepID=J0CTI6_AURST|nr:hypothetical protein AURDEDRAFT_177296 [Auricularia subglabra TFB-10046 SS5]
MPNVKFHVAVMQTLVPDPLQTGGTDYINTDEGWTPTSPVPSGWVVSVLVTIEIELLDHAGETALFDQIFDYDAYSRA